jgi:hypothetical protein
LVKVLDFFLRLISRFADPLVWHSLLGTHLFFDIALTGLFLRRINDGIELIDQFPSAIISVLVEWRDRGELGAQCLMYHERCSLKTSLRVYAFER